ncbi:ester cyclase [Azospirillum sp. ST 5-10]|uniref:ester cyclase n=1 Tax=unclassified Azospirillum TaxID=2630922 RepID=UPI003F4A6298
MGHLTIAVGALAALTAPEPDTARLQATDANGAVAIVRPLYEALTASSPEDVRARLEAATAPDWQNCAFNDTCETREATIARWSARIARIPDFSFEIREVLVSGNRIIVRSEAGGAPVGPFMGVDPRGRSFRIMTLDVHETRAGKIVRTFHAEDWARAARQVTGEP